MGRPVEITGRGPRLREILLSWLLGFSLSLLGAKSSGTVWLVEHDPNQPEDQIGQVVLHASEGDTIRVGPGIYYEHIPLPAIGLVLESTEGAESTILDGGRVFPDREGSVLYFKGTGPLDLTLRGFTIRGGTGMRLLDGTWVVGGGIAVSRSAMGGRVVLVDCTIAENELRWEEAFEYRGGGIYCDGLAESRFVGCHFAANRLYGRGGHLYLDGGDHTFEDCSFDLDLEWAGEGTSIYQYLGGLSLLSCSFHASGSCNDWRGNIIVTSRDVTIRNCLFKDEAAACARQVSVLSFTSDPISHILSNCLFVGPDSDVPDMNDLDLGGAGPGLVEVTGNTIVGCRLWAATAFDGVVAMRDNIFFHSSVNPAATNCDLLCNCAWPDTIETRHCRWNLNYESNLNSDPQFCEESLGDYRLARTSPCTEENAPDGCGQIGALGIGCNGTATKGTTWGRLRFLFR